MFQEIVIHVAMLVWSLYLRHPLKLEKKNVSVLVFFFACEAETNIITRACVVAAGMLLNVCKGRGSIERLGDGVT